MRWRGGPDDADATTILVDRLDDRQDPRLCSPNLATPAADLYDAVAHRLRFLGDGHRRTGLLLDRPDVAAPLPEDEANEVLLKFQLLRGRRLGPHEAPAVRGHERWPAEGLGSSGRARRSGYGRDD